MKTRSMGPPHHPARTISRLASLTIAVVVVAVVAGCGDRQQKETVRGLQEENAVLREKITYLEQRLNDVQTADRASRAEANTLGDEKLAQAEQQVSSLRLELASVSRERLALQETLNQQPRIAAAQGGWASNERLALVTLLLLALMVLGFMAVRYRATSDRLHMLTMQRVAHLRQLDGGR